MIVICFDQLFEIATCDITRERGMTTGVVCDEIEDGSKRGGRTRTGTRTYDDGMAEAGESGSRTHRHPTKRCGRTSHLPKLYHDLISRLRLARDAPPPFSVAAAAHGQVRRAQGYSASMLVEESRVFQVATFSTLHLHQSELTQNQVLLDVMVIADEVDAQLMEAVRSLIGAKLIQPAV